MTGNYFRLVFLLLLAKAGLWAQSDAQPGIPGEVPSLRQVRKPETSGSNAFVAGFRIATEFDDNALNDDRDKQTDMISAIESHVGWVISEPRLNWLLDYRLGLSLQQQAQFNTSQSHLLDTDLQFRMTNRLKAHLRNSFLASKDPFERLSGSGAATGPGVLDRPNDSIAASGARRNSEQAGLDLTYATSPHGITGISGSFYSVAYTAAAQPEAQSFQDTSSVTGHAFYSHHLTPRYWAGSEYNIQKLVAHGGQSLVHSVFFTQTISITPETALSAFAGPELSKTSPTLSFVGLPGGMLRWSWAGGVIYHWGRPRTSVVASAYRKVSDGGGVLGIVRLTGASIDFHRELSRRWTAELATAYGRNHLLTDAPGTLSTISVVGGLTCRLNQNLALDIRYWRARVPATDATLIHLADHNRVSVALTYDFKGPFGR